MIIGIAGTIGSGKGTVVRYLKEKGFAHYSSSAFLKEVLAAQGLPLTRGYMSPLASEMRREDAGGVPKKNYEKFLKEQPENAVFEALHSPEEAEFIRSIGGRILGVDASLESRYARSVGRDEEKDRLSFEEFKIQSRIEDEGSGEDPKRYNNIRGIFEHADAVIMNNGTLPELRAQIDEVLERLQQT